MYTCVYDSWDSDRFPGYQECMDHLYDRSLLYYQQVPFEKNEEQDKRSLQMMFGFMEYYFAAIMKLGFVGKSNFSTVLEQMKSIQSVELLDPALRERINGLTYKGRMIMNPTPQNYSGLDQSSSFQLAMYHELGHIITSCNKEDLEFLQTCVFHPTDISKESYYFQKGIELLDEVVAENVGEAVLYDRNRIPRPEPFVSIQPVLYPNGQFLTNFAEYREFQELAYRFAKCLDFIPEEKKSSMDDCLHAFSKAMFSKDFCMKMFDEFKKDPEKGNDLIDMMCCMGKIKEAKYSSFGLGTLEKDQLDVTSSFEIFDRIASTYESSEDCKENSKIQS